MLSLVRPACLALLFSLAGCASADPAAQTADQCQMLKSQCDSCAQRDLKENCLNSMTSAKSAGEAGQRTCKAAVESQAYAGKECQPCKAVKTQCDLCGHAAVKADCNALVTANKTEQCQEALTNNTFRKECGSCGTLREKCASCTDGDLGVNCLRTYDAGDDDACKSLLSSPDFQTKCK